MASNRPNTIPRKTRRRQPSAPRNNLAISDYESDAAVAYSNPHGFGPQINRRSNTELNIGVLQRYEPSIQSITSIAANAVVYMFASATQTWEKSGVEGTLFVCAQDPVVIAGCVVPRSCVFVLNRKGLDNVVVDLLRVTHCEVAAELLIFKMKCSTYGSDEEQHEFQVIGLWMHADQADTQQVNATIIHQLWDEMQPALALANNVLSPGLDQTPCSVVRTTANVSSEQVSLAKSFRS